MELAVKGNPKYLTSRVSQDSYDTPDNRYIHYTLIRVLYLMNSIATLMHDGIAVPAFME